MKKFKVKQITGIFTWIHFNSVDRCAICRNNLNEPSIDFQTIKLTESIIHTDDAYFIVLGKCGHIFHLDCVEKWLFENQKCPLCVRIWYYEKISKLNLTKTK
nr:ring-box protein 1 [Cryptomonas curvata]